MWRAYDPPLARLGRLKPVQTYRQRIKEKLDLETAAELSAAATRGVVSQSS